MFADKVKVNSPHVEYTDDAIYADYDYQTTKVHLHENGGAVLVPHATKYQFRTSTKLPRLGVMLVGWGGNNGSTVTAGIIANRNHYKWRTPAGIKSANYYGSIVMSSTVCVGQCGNEDVFAPLSALLPMVNPDNIVLGGWDISASNLAEAMERAQVINPDLQRQLAPVMSEYQPLPSVYYPGFIAANQADRADNLIPGDDKARHLETIRQDIQTFKKKNKLDKVIVMWTANTERNTEIMQGVNDTADALLNSIKKSHPEVAPSTLFAVAAILEGCAYINGSPQNTFTPGCVELAESEKVFIGGDDFKSGQTKVKSVIVDFLVKAGLKPKAIVSYNHLGNNDGKNLSAPQQFRSKEISKSNVIDDVVASNPILYDKEEKPDHVVVIKYVPTVGDSKRAMDEYTSEIFLGGVNTIVTHNTCEDSLLAAPLIIDLVLICELATRIMYKVDNMKDYDTFHPVLSILSYLLKAPLVPKGTPVVNALFQQRACIENILRACIGLAPENSMRLEHKKNDVERKVNGNFGPPCNELN